MCGELFLGLISVVMTALCSGEACETSWLSLDRIWCKVRCTRCTSCKGTLSERALYFK